MNKPDNSSSFVPLLVYFGIFLLVPILRPIVDDYRAKNIRPTHTQTEAQRICLRERNMDVSAINRGELPPLSDAKASKCYAIETTTEGVYYIGYSITFRDREGELVENKDIKLRSNGRKVTFRM